MNGVAFKHFLEIIKNGYFIKCAVLTDGDEGKKTENRATNLKRDYEKPYRNIKVSINKETFEKELIEANKDGKGKKVLLKALNSTRPILGPDYSEKISNQEIGNEEFFSMIEEYKSEFAFNLGDELKKIGKSDFNVPTYIEKVFEFIMDIEG